MYGNKSFLMLGADSPADLLSLIKGGYEILDCEFAFQQGIDRLGKATTRVHAGTIHLTISQLPNKPLIEWALDSRKYLDGSIILLDNENAPVEKIIFQEAACVGMDIDYLLEGEAYAATRLTLEAYRLVVGSGISFSNQWTY